jgi:hypothetical protein
MSAHTPGPWKYRPATRTTHQAIGLGPNGLLVIKNEVSDADARLIAAAPDLLAACRFAASALSTDPVQVEYAQKGLRDAIAKAEGRA